MSAPKRRVGPFVLTEQIGGGRGTALFRAIREDSGRAPRQVAIRAANNPDDTQAADRIVREYEVLRVLDSPRIPRVYGFYEEEAALALTYCEGVNLSDVLVAHQRDWVQLDPATALDMAIETAHALRHAQSIRFGGGSRIVHGHLGPQRIRLCMDGRIVVVGFGASAQGQNPAYTAPEVANGAMPTRLSDQWSLGATIVEMLTGERLYTGTTDPKQAARLGDVSASIRKLERLHPEVAATVRTMLATDPKSRFRKQAEMLKALLGSARRIGGTVHRRHLVANVLLHGDQLMAMRPSQPIVRPLAYAPRHDEPAVHIPPRPISSTPEPEPSVQFLEVGSTEVPSTALPPAVDQELDPIPDMSTPPIPIHINDKEEPLFDSPDIEEPTHPTSTDVHEQPQIDGNDGKSENERDYADMETAPLHSRSPTATAAFLPSEIAGFVLGGLLFILGTWYALTVL